MLFNKDVLKTKSGLK